MCLQLWLFATEAYVVASVAIARTLTAVKKSYWRNQRVLFRSDNMAVVYEGFGPPYSTPIRCLAFFEAHFAFEYETQYEHNTGADALSRDNFLFHCSQAASCQSQARIRNHSKTSSFPQTLAEHPLIGELAFRVLCTRFRKVQSGHKDISLSQAKIM